MLKISTFTLFLKFFFIFPFGIIVVTEKAARNTKIQLDIQTTNPPLPFMPKYDYYHMACNLKMDMLVKILLHMNTY